LAFFEADSLAQFFAGISGKLFPLALGRPVAAAHPATSAIHAAHWDWQAATVSALMSWRVSVPPIRQRPSPAGIAWNVASQ
jgi:hypothetical protein